MIERIVNIKHRLKKHLQSNLHFWTILVLLVLFVVVYFAPRIFITIHAGHAGVLFKRFFGGTIVNKVYKEGFHIIWPFNIMNVYDVRVTTTEGQINILTKEGLPVEIEYSYLTRPEYELLGYLHKRYGPKYLDQTVVPDMNDILRSTMGQYNVWNIYDNQGKIVQEVINRASEELAHKYVEVIDVNLKKVTLSDEVVKDIENLVQTKILANAHDYSIEKEQKELVRMQIEATAFKEYTSIVSPTLYEQLLRFKGIQATEQLSRSPNAKVLIVGAGKDGLPVILDTR